MGEGRAWGREGHLEPVVSVFVLPEVVLDEEDGTLVCHPWRVENRRDDAEVSESRAVDEHQVGLAQRTRLKPAGDLAGGDLLVDALVEVAVELLARPLGPFASLDVGEDELLELVSGHDELIDHLDVPLLVPVHLSLVER
eukprot:762768-Hanusia_phi.AAC.6